MSIRNYVDVNISQESAMLARLGFNIPIFLFEDDDLDRTRIVSTSDYDNAHLGGTTSELYKAFQTYLSQPIVAPSVVIGCKRTTDDTWGEAISAIREENDNWYGMVSVSKTKADIVAISAVAETIKPGRLHFAITGDADVKNAVSENVAEVLSEAGYFRTALIFSSDTDVYANAGQCAYLGYEPGSFTFNYKEIRGVKAEVLTAQQRQNLIDQKCQVQRTVSGLKRLVDSGMVSSGEWIDIMHGIDWMTARLSENIFAILASTPKVAMNDGGLAVLGTEMRRNLAIANSAPYNFINDDYTVFIPLAENISPVDKANRTVDGLTFEASPQGAIHIVKVRGKLIT